MELGIDILKLTCGVLLFMTSNIIAGSYKAWSEGQFDKETLIKGIKKALIILTGFICIYSAGIMNPDVLAIDIDGNKVNVVTAIHLMAIVTFISYANQSITKYFDIIKTKKVEVVEKLKE